MIALRRSAFAVLLLAAPLVLAGCKKDDAGAAGPPKGAAVAAVTPPAGKVWTDVVSATPDGGMKMGNPNAPIKLVEYGSLSCPHCAHLAQEGMQTLEQKYVNSGKVSYEFRSFPIHGIIDVPLTVMVKCAAPEAFFPLVQQIYVDQDAIMNRAQQGNAQAEAASKLPPAQRMVALADAFGLTDWFAARGVSVDQSHACLANAAAAQAVADQGEKWSNAGINQTPTLEINGTVLKDVATWQANGSMMGLETALQQAGAR